MQVMTAISNPNEELVISSDSHVLEDSRMWEERLPKKFAADAPIGLQPKPGEVDTERFVGHRGGWDPVARVEEMQMDGVSAEILYPSFGMNLFSLTDPALQEACFRVYNDYLRDFCSVAPERLLPIPMLSTWEISRAVKELERCHELGDPGAMIWQQPPAELTFDKEHYFPLWEAAEGLNMSIGLHTATGIPFKWNRPPGVRGKQLPDLGRGGNTGLMAAATALSDFIFGGALERFPGLRVLLVESDASWIPFLLGKYDASYLRYTNTVGASSLSLTPTEYFQRQIYATFIHDQTLGQMLGFWGSHNCMWSNDFPHAVTSWPSSLKTIEEDLGHLSPTDRELVLSGNALELYPRLKDLKNQ